MDLQLSAIIDYSSSRRPMPIKNCELPLALIYLYLDLLSMIKRHWHCTGINHYQTLMTIICHYQSSSIIVVSSKRRYISTIVIISLSITWGYHHPPFFTADFYCALAPNGSCTMRRSTAAVTMFLDGTLCWRCGWWLRMAKGEWWSVAVQYWFIMMNDGESWWKVINHDEWCLSCFYHDQECLRMADGCYIHSCFLTIIVCYHPLWMAITCNNL